MVLAWQRPTESVMEQPATDCTCSAPASLASVLIDDQDVDASTSRCEASVGSPGNELNMCVLCLAAPAVLTLCLAAWRSNNQVKRPIMNIPPWLHRPAPINLA